MNVKKYYNKIEKINHKNYTINHEFNILLLQELECISNFTKKENLYFSIIGTLGCIFHTNKIYRTLNDIDILIEKTDFKKWLDYLSKNYNFKYTSTNLLFKSVSQFIQEQVSKNGGIPFVKRSNTKIQLELFFVDNFNIHKDKFFNKVIEKSYIKYRIPYKYRPFEKVHFYDRQKDNDDIQFYSQYLKYPEDFIK